MLFASDRSQAAKPSNAAVFATTAPSIIPLENARGRKVVYDFSTLTHTTIMTLCGLLETMSLLQLIVKVCIGECRE